MGGWAEPETSVLDAASTSSAIRWHLCAVRQMACGLPGRDSDQRPSAVRGLVLARLFVVSGETRVSTHLCAGGSGWSIGPSAPWTAFEYKNCTGACPPMLSRIS